MTDGPRHPWPDDVLTTPQGRPYFVGASYQPEDEAAGRKLLARLESMTREEFLQSLIRSGICDASGKLLPPYAEEDEEERPSQPPR